MGNFKYIVKVFEKIPSTQDVAHKYAQKGAAEGLVIIANKQLKGRGKMGRSWYSAEGSLCFSLLLRPTVSLLNSLHFTFLMAVAVANALEEITSLTFKIKQPNDILLNNKKICGILTDIRGGSNYTKYVIIGVGLNLNVALLPMELKTKATSLYLETGKHFDIFLVLNKILQKLRFFYLQYLKRGINLILKEWQSKLVCGDELASYYANFEKEKEK